MTERDDVEFTVVDLRHNLLAPYDLPAPPAMAPRVYHSDLQRTLGEQFDSFDGFIVVTNEFNHGYSAALKNTLDYFSAEFHRKPVAFIGYGNVGGARAIEQLRQVVAELEMVSIRHAVHIVGAQMAPIREGGDAAAAIWDGLDPRLDVMVDDLLWWATALQAARQSR